jgi:hypothetical protein
MAYKYKCNFPNKLHHITYYSKYTFSKREQAIVRSIALMKIIKTSIRPHLWKNVFKNVKQRNYIP